MNGVVNQISVVRTYMNVSLGVPASTSHNDDVSRPGIGANRGVSGEIHVILEENAEDVTSATVENNDFTVVDVSLRRVSFKDNIDSREMVQGAIVSEDLGSVGTGFARWEDTSAVHPGL